MTRWFQEHERADRAVLKSHNRAQVIRRLLADVDRLTSRVTELEREQDEARDVARWLWTVGGVKWESGSDAAAERWPWLNSGTAAGGE